MKTCMKPITTYKNNKKNYFNAWALLEDPWVPDPWAVGPGSLDLPNEGRQKTPAQKRNIFDVAIHLYIMCLKKFLHTDRLTHILIS